MKCQSCQFDNPIGMKFCGECGKEIHPSCPHCGFTNPPTFKFCGNCGCGLAVGGRARNDIPSQPEETPIVEANQDENACYGPDSERKCVTVMFSDLTGYTEMSEKLDPEEVKEITSAIFGELTKIIEKYDGFIEKYIGDAILAVFGAKEAFEDSALRAIKAARAIHAYVESVTPKYKKLIGRPLSMHTGINTGVVVTGDINFEKGTHGLVGDTINTAARLMSVSQTGEIVVDKNSFTQTEGYFEFEALEPVKVKGKTHPISIYRVTKSIHTPQKLHRLHGLRSALIGRSIEMQILEEAAERLRQGEKGVVSVSGIAGNGKSRLVMEFKRKLDRDKIQWFEAHAYPYTQNTPYYPLIDLFTRTFQIEEGDSAETILIKIETGLKGIPDLNRKTISYVASLFSIDTDETRDVSPEFWQKELFQSVRDVIDALTSLGPTVICMEDLHWSDPSFLELIRYLITETSGSILFICIYRPLISLFTDLETRSLNIFFKDLCLKELSPTETQGMVGSLLQSDNVPSDLKRFVHESVEGNPFYVEELINSLIDAGILIKRNGNWEITRTINESGIPNNIQGVLAGRIDRLGKDVKRIIQEASVIGRVFLYDILQRISKIDGNIDKYISVLERMDLIRARSIQPTLEYIFKHAMTQEIVYNGLIKSERQIIHEKIGKVIEALFSDRIPEFYESLAFHYSRGKSVLKAVDYCIKAGKKCMKRYSLDESDRYYKTARDLLDNMKNKTGAVNEMTIELINEWAMVFYYRGAFAELGTLLHDHEEVAASITNREKQGIFMTWQGMVYWAKSEYNRSRDYLERALALGDENGLDLVVVYACTWLSWLYAYMGLFSQGIDCGRRGNQLAIAIKAEHFFVYKPLAGIASNLGWKGMASECIDMGQALIQYGKRHSQVRCLTLGYASEGIGRLAAGDISTAIDLMEKAVNVSMDDFYKNFSIFFLAFINVLNGRIEIAKRFISPLTEYFDANQFKIGYDGLSLIKGLILIDKGEMRKGMSVIEDQLQQQRQKGDKGSASRIFLIIGMIYSTIIKREKSIPPMIIMKNIGFVIQNIPQAEKKAIANYKRAIEISQEIGALGISGQAHFGIGKIHALKKRHQFAIDHLEQAIQIFEKVGAYAYLEQARKEIENLTSASKSRAITT